MHVFEEAVIPRSVKGRRYPSQGMRDCKNKVRCCYMLYFWYQRLYIDSLKEIGGSFLK